MKVGVVPSDVPSCEHYRSRAPAEALHRAGEIEYERLIEGPRLRFARRSSGDLEPVGLVNPPDVDVVVFVRGCFPRRILEVIKLLQREGIAVVIDYDDCYDRLPPSLYNLYKIGPHQNPYYNWRNALQGAKIADGVTVSTPALLRYRPDAKVLRNTISRYYVERGRQIERSGDLVGWTGTCYGHPGDLRQCGAGVAEALRRTGARFYNVGDGVDVKRDLSLDDDPEVSGIVFFDEFLPQLAKIDVGIAPLVLDHYRRDAKSWLKPLEYMAVGAQYVASPSNEYLTLQVALEQWANEQGIDPDHLPGQVVRKNRGRSWRAALLEALRTMDDLELRRARARVARTFVEARLLMEDHAWRFAEAWEQAVRVRRASKRSSLV